jgi:hypothetical protein
MAMLFHKAMLTNVQPARQPPNGGVHEESKPPNRPFGSTAGASVALRRAIRVSGLTAINSRVIRTPDLLVRSSKVTGTLISWAHHTPNHSPDRISRDTAC